MALACDDTCRRNNSTCRGSLRFCSIVLIYKNLLAILKLLLWYFILWSAFVVQGYCQRYRGIYRSLRFVHPWKQSFTNIQFLPRLCFLRFFSFHFLFNKFVRGCNSSICELTGRGKWACSSKIHRWGNGTYDV